MKININALKSNLGAFTTSAGSREAKTATYIPVLQQGGEGLCMSLDETIILRDKLNEVIDWFEGKARKILPRKLWPILGSKLEIRLVSSIDQITCHSAPSRVYGWTSTTTLGTMLSWKQGTACRATERTNSLPLCQLTPPKTDSCTRELFSSPHPVDHPSAQSRKVIMPALTIVVFLLDAIGVILLACDICFSSRWRSS